MIVIASIFFVLLPGLVSAEDSFFVIPVKQRLTDHELMAICRGYKIIGQIPPDKYKCPMFVFVTSEKWDGALGGIAGADAKCQQAANNSDLTKGSVFRAWISDAYSWPAKRFVRSDTPYVTTCRETKRVANNWEDLVDGSAIGVKQVCTEFGESVTSVHWTYTDVDGRLLGDGESCWNWSGNSFSGIGARGFFQPDVTTGDHDWTKGSYTMCNATQRLLCFEQPKPDLSPGTFSGD